MRIAMLSWESLHSIAVGGVAAHVTELAAALARRGHQVHVFTRRAFGQAGHDWTDDVHYHRCTYAPHSDFVDDINSMCRSFVDHVFEVEDLVGRFDVIHAHDWLTANALIWIKQGRGHKCLFTIHSTEYARCGNAFPMGRAERIRHQERAGTYWADRVIAVSQATKDEITWMYEVPPGKTSVVYNGVSPERFEQPTDVGADKRRYHIGPLDPTILFCGRLSWQKGPDILVEAIPAILRRHPSARFVFAGEGDMRDALESRIRQLGVAHAVRFVGYRSGEELVRLYNLADVVCMPSRNEPFGIVVLEARSAGKPVVASQNGGPAEYVQHEVNGLKIYPNPESVAWGVGHMLSDLDGARWMGRNGRKTVQEQFTWDTITEQMLAVYQGLCPSPVVLPHRAADRVQRILAESSQETSWAGAWDDNLLAVVGKQGTYGPPIDVQAKLHFTAADLEGEADDALTACQSSLARSGLNPQRQDHTLAIKGDWETVLAALQRYGRHM
ncbi:MAG: glycosyltransferase family 4 protein [Planctomycetes bacterium]|nr:glycosyltransferase family 4 protein [Planctomycetota bacterium]